MKNFTSKLMVTLAIFFMIAGCGNTRKATEYENFIAGQQMKGYSYVYTARQVDSMCTVDHISPDMNKWKGVAYKDFETEERVVKYLYIKVMNDSLEVRYTLIPKGDNSFKVNKVIVNCE